MIISVNDGRLLDHKRAIIGNVWKASGHWQHGLQSPEMEVETWNNAARLIAAGTHYAGRPTYLLFSVNSADLKSYILGWYFSADKLFNAYDQKLL